MREIKFRAWDGIRMTTSGIMFNASTGYLEVPTHVSFNPSGAPIDTYKLMQFTGLLDVNGKEIYEGDVLLHKGEPFDEFDDGLFKFEVKFEDGGFWNWDESITPEKCEIIGNIYEHSNLIENDK